MNTGWALQELEKYIGLIAQCYRPGSVSRIPEAKLDEITKLEFVVDKILDRVTPLWKSRVQPNRLSHRDAAIRAREALLRDRELQENLGDNAPEISAANLHPWVWNGARPLWQSGHYRSAVEDALKKVNAETQNKVGRRDLSETKLFQESFSENPPLSGKPRLRRMKADGSDTYKSLQRGALSLADGIYAGIRNPLNHGEPRDMDEQVALEYLAAISVLARWVDESTLEDVK